MFRLFSQYLFIGSFSLQQLPTLMRTQALLKNLNYLWIKLYNLLFRLLCSIRNVWSSCHVDFLFEQVVVQPYRRFVGRYRAKPTCSTRSFSH